METFIGTLALAAITAITIVAYRHPNGYRKLHKAISEFALWAFIAIAGYAVGTESTHRLLGPYIRQEKVTEAANAVARVTPNPWWVFLIFLAILGFLVFLRLLPDILEHDPDNKTQR